MFIVNFWIKTFKLKKTLCFFNQAEIIRLNQIQHRAAKLCTGALHLTNWSKLEADLGWETLQTRANFLGLSQFQKFHLKLVLSLMPNISQNYLII